MNHTTSGLFPARLPWRRLGPFVYLLMMYISFTFLVRQMSCPSLLSSHLLLPSPQIMETNAFLANAEDASHNNNGPDATITTAAAREMINNDQLIRPRKKAIQTISCPQAPNSLCRLEFVHIPKTAGTAIEVAAVMANQTWSVCHWREMFRLGPRKKIYTCPPRQPVGRKRSEGPPIPSFNSKISLWHLPPIFFFPKGAETKKFPRNPYAENAALFTVVRNPYDRAISEYYSAHDGLTEAQLNISKLNNAANMNRYLIVRLQWYLKNAKNVGDLILFPQVEKKENLTIPYPIYFQADGHYIPQYDYVFYEGRRVIHHVLHFENLQEDFAALMQAYNRTDVILPQKPKSSSSSTTTNTTTNTTPETGRVSHVRRLGVDDLTNATIQMIDHIYARDFMAFGYQAKSHVADLLF